MYCSKCGTAVQNGANFCSGCGAPLSAPQRPNYAPIQKAEPSAKRGLFRRTKKPENRIIPFPGDVETVDQYAVLDVETTGLDPAEDQIIEIAILKMAHSKDVGRYETLVATKRKLSSDIVELTGIQQKQLKNAKPEGVMCAEVSSFLGGLPIVAHNATFDAEFLARAFSRAGIEHDVVYIDTLQLARQAYPDLGSYKLVSLAKHLGISSDPQAHRAMPDVICTCQLYNLCRLQLKASRTMEDELKQINGAARAAKSAKMAPELFLAYDHARSALTQAHKKDFACASFLFGDVAAYMDKTFSSYIDSIMGAEYEKEKKALQRLKTRSAMLSHVERFRAVYDTNQDKLSPAQLNKLQRYEADLMKIVDMVAPE